MTFSGAAAAVWKYAKGPTTLLREYFLLDLVSLATVTGLYFWLDVPLAAAAFTYLVSNLSSLIVLSFIAVGCLSYFLLLRFTASASITRKTSSQYPRL
jgi:hypothetical protein